MSRELTPSELVVALQKACPHPDGVYYAYFSRARMYSYHYAETMEDLIKSLPTHEELVGDCVSIDLKIPGKVDFRSDEWIIFHHGFTADQFCLSVSEKHESD